MINPALSAPFDLCRMTIEEAGYHPEAMAAAVHLQLPQDLSGPVPIKEIARALDIHEIRAKPLQNFEGALLTGSERTAGSILVNGMSHYRRQRFTIGHELLHFLNPRHQPTDDLAFRCRSSEIGHGQATATSSGMGRHQRQEREANRFAVELLLPRNRLHRRLSAPPELETVLSISDEFDVSKEAAARYYAERHDACIGIAHSHKGRLRYLSRHPKFPYPRISTGMGMPLLPQITGGSNLTDIETGNPIDWFTEPGESEVSVQTLYQQDGHALTLIIVERDEGDEQEMQGGLDRDIPRFGR